MKILLYGNSWDDFKSLIEVAHPLEKEGAEVAVATDNKDLLLPLSVGKLLVVNPKTYYYDYVVTNKKGQFHKDSLTVDEMKEVLR